MATKVRYVFMGIDGLVFNQILSLVMGGGLIEQEYEVVAFPGTPSAYSVDPSGNLHPVEFSKAINIVAQTEKRKILNAQAAKGAMLVDDVVAKLLEPTAVNAT